jgi:endonuclease/exonuclease/phosphatase family metal-dependent hydrolase
VRRVCYVRRTRVARTAPRRQTDRVSFDPYNPYGPVVETTMRVVTWNVWGRYGRWEERQAGIDDVLAVASADVVCLVESWSTEERTQADLIGDRLGLPHRLFVGDRREDDWTSGLGLVSRWPVSFHEHRPLPGNKAEDAGTALFAALDGPRGLIQLFVVMLDYPLYASAVRQAQVRQLGAFVEEMTRNRHPTVICGDFNAGPDSDELGMLTGRTDTTAPGLVFYDAWELAGDGTPGDTWSNQNPLAALGMYPNRRFDYILSAWPRANAVGHPTHCELLGVIHAPQGTQLSDHYGVLADLRY